MIGTIEFGDRVLVPRHNKLRGQDRIYDRGVVIGIRDGIATIRLEAGNDIYAPVGLLSLTAGPDAAQRVEP